MSAVESAPAPMVNVCMFCHQTIGPDQRPRSQYIESGAVVSHGVCLPCTPAYCADLGLSESETKRIIAANTPKSKTPNTYVSLLP